LQAGSSIHHHRLVDLRAINWVRCGQFSSSKARRALARTEAAAELFIAVLQLQPLLNLASASLQGLLCLARLPPPPNLASPQGLKVSRAIAGLIRPVQVHVFATKQQNGRDGRQVVEAAFIDEQDTPPVALTSGSDGQADEACPAADVRLQHPGAAPR
jgi:hypothetical protein